MNIHKLLNLHKLNQKLKWTLPDILLLFDRMQLCDCFCSHASALQAVGESVTKSENQALYSNLLSALLYILSLNAFIGIFSEAEALISIGYFASTNRKRPD